MSRNDGDLNESASEQIFAQLEKDMEPGGGRDLWLAIRRKLNEGGPEGVRTYLEAEYERRKAIIQKEVNELSNQLEEIS
ncbi:MAG: hypothetical protein OXO50_16055 [Caldilineaceae bacterium]|nr:hypothetical protein [Caldilineaceae bacterium]